MNEEEAYWDAKADALWRPETTEKVRAALVALDEDRALMVDHSAKIEDHPEVYREAVRANIELIEHVTSTLRMTYPYKVLGDG